MNKDKCYNSGKIGGLPYLVAYKKFQEADERIFLMGLQPINPMKDGIKYCRPWWMHMIVDLYMMLQCKFIYMQPDWKESKGARIERRIAKLFGKKILEYYV